MERIILALCEQTNTNLSHINLGDLPYPATGTGMSPHFGAMSINRQNSGGSAAPSAHSSVRSAHSREPFCGYCNFRISLFSQFMQDRAASPAHGNHPGGMLRRPNWSDIQYKSSFSRVVVGSFFCIYMPSEMKSFTCRSGMKCQELIPTLETGFIMHRATKSNISSCAHLYVFLNVHRFSIGPTRPKSIVHENSNHVRAFSDAWNDGKLIC